MLEHFDRAVAATRILEADSAAQPNAQQRFMCYGLYKQAMVGPCTEQAPSELDSLASWKYQAWAHQGRKSRAAAQFEYACIMFSVFVESTANSETPDLGSPEQQAFVRAFTADAERLRALRVSEDGQIQVLP